MTMISASPACSASRRITSDSNAFRRQPKVTTSTLMISGDVGEQRGIETSLIFEIGGAGHQHVIVALAPFERELAAGQRDFDNAIGALQPRGGNRGRAGRRA